MSEVNDNLEELNSEDPKSTLVKGMYEDWFLDYASYVILERAVPAINDGLKPVQRRIMHSMKEMDDGRFNKVANIIGQTMQYHPHGDAAIGDAIINLGQKDLLIETQGNWGDIRTGDSAAAPRYIEARLSNFAKDVLFNPEITEWQLSYDSRKKEPVCFPAKFPLVLAQGVEGIAVGLATRIMPHNFIELLEASINYLKGKPFELLPDFPTGGIADFTEYKEGLRGGKIRMRAKIEKLDKKTLVIREIPFYSTTNSLIDSVIKANDKGKIKIKKITDNTAEHVEILIELQSGISPDLAEDALYAFTDCEISVSPNCCVIKEDKPVFMGVNDILKYSTEHTRDVLRQELEIQRKNLLEKIHFASLEKIFIEERIYRDIEECETWEAVIESIDEGLKPFLKDFYREVTREDIIRLTEIRIKRISKFDSNYADDNLAKLKAELKAVEHNLANITDYTIEFFKKLISKYGKGKERKTEIRVFENIQASQVAVANQKLYANFKEGFIGTDLKKDEFVCDCSDLDDIIVFRGDGKYLVTRVSDKTFVGKDIWHVGVWKKSDERMVYNAIYTDSKSKRTFVKRFQVKSITRDKEYDVTQGHEGSIMRYLTANPNAEAETITVTLTPGCSARKKVFDFDFSDLEIKGKGSKGNTLTRYPVKKIVQKEAGVSTLGGIDIWLDEVVGRLNTDERGRYLGNFSGDDKILAISKKGSYTLTTFELTNKYDLQDLLIVEKFNPEKAITAIHFDGEKGNYYVKRFLVETTSIGQAFTFINDEHKNSKLELVTTHQKPAIELHMRKGKYKEKIQETVELAEFIDIKGWRAIGNRLTTNTVDKIIMIDRPETETQTETPTDPDDTLFPETTSNKPEPEEKKAEKPTPEPEKEKPANKSEDKPKSSDTKKFQPGQTIEWDLNEEKKKDNDKPEQGSLF
ncbi:MAG: DNA gyrase/topoisomerase IV subunit A [Chitinophagaceae bacterium]|nr:MAG: DNA gyrase/topoisomerase IV subunit A [Chitinophagaceae bacterium]